MIKNGDSYIFKKSIPFSLLHNNPSCYRYHYQSFCYKVERRDISKFITELVFIVLFNCLSVQ